jgi:hypothetical protein
VAKEGLRNTLAIHGDDVAAGAEGPLVCEASLIGSDPRGHGKPLLLEPVLDQGGDGRVPVLRTRGRRLRDREGESDARVLCREIVGELDEVTHGVVAPPRGETAGDALGVTLGTRCPDSTSETVDCATPEMLLSSRCESPLARRAPWITCPMVMTAPFSDSAHAIRGRRPVP